MNETETHAFKEQLNRIERCLVGDADMGQLGLVSRMNNHAGRIKKLEMWVYRWGAYAVGGSVVISLGYRFLTDWWPRK